MSLNELKCKDVIQDHHVYTLNNGKRIIRDVSHIRIISPLIIVLVKNHHIEGMNKIFKIMSDDLTMS